MRALDVLEHSIVLRKINANLSLGLNCKKCGPKSLGKKNCGIKGGSQVKFFFLLF